jgi:hypothetical protein
MRNPLTTLHTEAQAYERTLPENLEHHAGQYVVIQGAKVAHFAGSYEAALDWAYEQFGLDAPFFVKLVATDHAAAHFTRDLGPCRT